MEIHTLLLIGHLLGVIFGVGGATASDLTFFRAAKNKKVSTDQYEILKSLSYLLWTGLTLAFVTGLGFLYLQYANTGELALLGSSRFQMKMTVIAAIFLNGLVFHFKVFPILKKGDLSKHTALLAISGAISIVSWYSAFLLGLLRILTWPYLIFLNVYLLLVACAAFSGYFMLSRIFVGKSVLPSKRVFSISLFALLAIVLGVLGGIMYSGRSDVVAGQTHEVCIREAAPWFYPEVLQIKSGDTVVWRHCHEEREHDRNHEFVHTHPILAIDGPEIFSSFLRPVGHDEGMEFRYTFNKAGVYTYLCPTHPYMKGIIAVDEEPEALSLWPPEEIIKPEFLPPPDMAGVGEIWINTQFEEHPDQIYPGTITVVDAETWEVIRVISHPTFNNPHNLWHSYDGRYVFQTQWHSDQFSKIDTQTKEVVATVSLGNAPAHVFVHPHEDRVYVTMNNENRVLILDLDLNHLGEIVTSFGPHGIWIDPSGRWMSVAATLEEKLDIIDLETEAVVASFEAPGLPLATAITHDGRYAMISLLLEGKVRFIDLETLSHVKDVVVGSMPIWPSPAPDGEHVYVPNTGSADVSVISLETLEVVKTIPGAQGAHGIIFGPKAGGGYYGYFSNKFARVMGVIDAEEMELVGYAPLGENAWGGNGILVLPNAYDEQIRTRN